MGTDERKPTAPTTPATCTVVGLPVRQHGKLVGPTAKLWASGQRVDVSGEHCSQLHTQANKSRKHAVGGQKAG